MNGSDLKKWRQKRGITQEDLGRALGVDRVTVNRWERETRSIPSFLPLALEALESRIKRRIKEACREIEGSNSPVKGEKS